MAGKLTLYLSDDNDILVSVGVFKDLPIISNVSKMTITRWVKDGLPFEMQGRRRVFPISKAIKWLIEHGKVDISNEILEEMDRSELPPDLRDKLASAELKEFKLQKEKELYIDKEEVSRQAFEIGKKLKDALYVLPSRFAEDLVGKNSNEIMQKMEEEINKLLENTIKDIEDAV